MEGIGLASGKSQVTSVSGVTASATSAARDLPSFESRMSVHHVAVRSP